MNAQARLRELMMSELERLQSRNSRYSLRAFAKRLELSPSQASDLLSGKRLFTGPLARKILGHLDDVESREAAALLEACDVERRGRKKQYAGAQVSVGEYRQLTVDQFRHIGDWRSFAVLSLSETQGFRDDPEWIARALSIPPVTARQILERLERLGVMERDADGRLRHAGVALASSTDVPSVAIRRAHRERLELASESLNRDAIDERDITGITMAIDPAKLPEAKKRIQEFRRSLSEFMESGSKKRVYHLAVQLFPMSKKELENEK